MGSSTYHIFPGLLDIELDRKKQKVSLRRWRKSEEPSKRNSKDIPQNFLIYIQCTLQNTSLHRSNIQFEYSP